MSDTALSSIPGMPVWGVVPGCPAHRAGVRVGDIVITVDGKATPDVRSYWEACKDRGRVTKIEVYRAGRILTFDLELNMNDAAA
jgi:serine protease Do